MVQLLLIEGYIKRARRREGLQGDRTSCAKDKKGGERIVRLKSWSEFCVAGAQRGRRGWVTGELIKWAGASYQAEELGLHAKGTGAP